MRHWGKVFGSSFGFMFGGPVGAMMGAAMGHNFDLGLALFSGLRPKTKEGKGKAHEVFLSATFRVMGFLAKANGRVSEQEINAAEAVITHLKLDARRKRQAIRWFDEGKQPGFVLNDTLFELRRHCTERMDLIRKFMEIQFSVAYADGIPRASERDTLLHISNQLGFSRLRFEAMDAYLRSRSFRQNGAGHREGRREGGERRTARVVAPLSEAYATLGIPRNASNEEITKAYRRLLNQHHPDKLMASGLSEEALALATAKTREIKTAYERIKVAKGF